MPLGARSLTYRLGRGEGLGDEGGEDEEVEAVDPDQVPLVVHLHDLPYIFGWWLGGVMSVSQWSVAPAAGRYAWRVARGARACMR